ncbi:hypothetical protein [Fibrobacter sp.]|uniref:hypothetical protein n=1 Tax=Fibrobacter sp. TaxID=35828 RepID=UPI0025C2CC9D|nr:hypothetical protein [Fibrobacter sp.]MBR2058868.1 hypothetical protein [Fibrobacter sp.]MBR4007859.1 hypothetical protein [Fibrobacter sp.]
MIQKLIDKFFTLTAFVSAACLTVHYTPAALIKGTYSFWSDDVLLLLFPLMTMASAILLLLDLFSLKIEIVQRKVWMFFAAVGIAPILPLALFSLVASVWFVICGILK